MNIMENNKNIKILKNELWTRQVTIKIEVIVIRENQVAKETILLEEIRRNKTKEQEV